MSQLTSNTTTIDELITLANNLPDAGSGEPTLQEKTVSPATSAQSVTPDSGYDGLSKVTVNAMPTATQATPSISVSSAGLITASATQTAGYVAAGTKSTTKQLTVQAAQTITPGTADKSIASGRYLTGTQTIKGDANLVAGNIKSGVSIFGVTGTHEGGEDVSAETAEYTSLLTDLETAIDALPDAGSGGSGGSVETCTVTVSEEYPGMGTVASSGAYYYTGADMAFSTGQWTSGESFSVTVAKGTVLILINYGGVTYRITGDAELVFGGRLTGTSSMNISVFSINGDCTIISPFM